MENSVENAAENSTENGAQAETKTDAKARFTVSKTDTLAIKAVAVMMMVIHHTFGFPERLAEGVGYDSMMSLRGGQPLEFMLGSFGKLCVALFMLLSGFGMYRSYLNRKRENGEVSFTQMIVKRIKNVYIKWWQILIIFGLIGLWLGAANIPTDSAVWLKNLLVIDTGMYPEAWFLVPYLITMCLFPLIIRWFERKHANMWVDAVFIFLLNTIVISLIIPTVSKYECLAVLCGSFFYQRIIVTLATLSMFMAGCFLAKYNVIERIRACFDYGYIAKLVGLVMIATVYVIRQNMLMPVQWGWDTLDFFYAAVFTIGMLLLLDGLNLIKKFLAFIGKQATGIWLIHAFFCYYYFQKFTYSFRNPILIFLFLMVVSSLLSWVIGLILSGIWSLLKRGVKKAPV